ncbi:MAG: ATP-dependent DNA helicase RecG [Coriobacteriia bacterium]|nr:ATP-dependent DNA helicase RecG [Coriobacteriia bacterium]
MAASSGSGKTVSSAHPAARLQAWGAPVAVARFVNAERAAQLEKLGITRIGQLFYHRPLRYLDMTHISTLAEVRLGEATVIGQVHEVRERRPRPKLLVTEVTLVDGTGTLLGVWFNQRWVKKTFQPGDTVAFAGSVKLEYGLNRIVQPFYEKLTEGEGPAHLGRILPVHPTTEGLSVGWLRRIIAAALDDFADVPEYLPQALLEARGLMGYSRALRQLHFPDSLAQAEEARRRLAYGEFFDFQLLMARRGWQARHAGEGTCHVTGGSLLAQMRAELPVTLTADQSDAVAEILRDMAAPAAMNRLLLGDVGTGKTLVAAFALVAAADTGTQAAMMAPTEVLAQQYAHKLGPQLDALSISWELLTSSTTPAERARIKQGLAGGAVTVAFGTHALLEEDISFKRLSLVVIDEQHRFGVEQRQGLQKKAQAPDVLIMTATPIPRTLALLAYGDLEISYLRTRPIKGAGVSTQLIDATRLGEAYDAVRRAAAAGQQAYVVCALVEESEALDARSVEEEAAHLKAEEFEGLSVEILTGKMRPADKEATMARFRAGEIQVLVATTVIEVGVDVPGATVMIVLDADRFGLAQLHQLRGRVGRGAIAGQVWLVARHATAQARQRLGALADIDDGFRLAELDLEMRGAGELLGSRQSGLARFAIGEVLADRDLIAAVRADVEPFATGAPFAPAESLLQLRITALEAEVAAEGPVN